MIGIPMLVVDVLRVPVCFSIGWKQPSREEREHTPTERNVQKGTRFEGDLPALTLFKRPLRHPGTSTLTGMSVSPPPTAPDPAARGGFGPPAIEADAPVVAVVAYPDRARVTRRGRVRLPA